MERGFRRAFAIMALAIGLASCGGGGGGGGGGGTGGSSPTPTLSVTADRTSLQFVGFTTSPPGGQSITFTLVNASASGEYYGQVVPDRPEDFSATFTPSGLTSAVVVVTPLRFQTGARSGSVTFRLCSDINCTKVAWTQTIPYTMGLYTVDATGLTLSGYEGVASAPASITVSPADTTGQLTVTTAVTNGAGWLSAVRATDSSFAVTATGATVATGSYQGQVRISVTGQSGGPTVNVPVSFTVGDGTIAPPSATADLGINSTLASMTGTAAVTFRGAQAPTWTASSDEPWLVLTQASGSGAGQVKYSIDPGKTDGIANWNSATARIKISATGLSDVSVPVTLNKKLPEVYAVSPGVVRAGSAGNVRVTGRGLSQLTGIGQIQVAGVGGLSPTVTSDTSAMLALPALAVGRSAMAISNAAGITTTLTTVGAGSLGTLPAGIISTTGSKRSSLFDPTRQALFAVDTTQNLLVRFTFSAGQWQTSTLAVERIGDMAMAPDRRTLYVVSGDATLLAVDPDNLTVRTSHATTGSQWDGSLWTGVMSTRGLPVTSNLRLWFAPGVGPGARYFDMLSQSFGNKTNGNGLPFSSNISASGDGSVMWLGLGTTSTYDPQGFLYSAAADTVTASQSAPHVWYGVGFGEDGRLALVDDEVLYQTADFILVGKAPVTSGIGSTALLSPDGRRVYRMITAGPNSTSIDHIDIYDTTQTATGGEFVKLGQITVPTQAANCSSDYACNGRGSFTISPLGDTLFWVGNQALVVLPIPTQLSGVLSNGPRLRPAATR